MDCKRKTDSKENEDRFICIQGSGNVFFWDTRRIISTEYLNQWRILCELTAKFQWRSQAKTATFGREESVVLSRKYTPVHKSLLQSPKLMN